MPSGGTRSVDTLTLQGQVADQGFGQTLLTLQLVRDPCEVQAAVGGGRPDYQKTDSGQNTRIRREAAAGGGRRA